MVDEATDMTPCGRGEKAVDMMHMRPVLRCGLVHADVALEPSIVPFLQSHQVVMDLGCQVDPGMQRPEPCGAIQKRLRQLPAVLGEVGIRYTLAWGDSVR